VTTVAVLGLGEAGGAIARDLLDAGVEVRGYDPLVAAPDGSTGCRDEADAARGADLVLSVNSATAAYDALLAGLHGCSPGTVWADLNTAPPALEERLASAAEGRAHFVDVSLMAPVPGRGLRTPMLAAGAGASAYADLLAPLGASVEVLDGPPGEAARRKLVRSVFFKGMAAAVTEALAAASRLDLEDWMREMVADELEGADRCFARRLEEGIHQHATRRAEEMAAAVEMLTELDVPPRVAAASRDWLVELRDARPH
jgi:3-hydroxyisobutyrate dehydrogenase-like beta-hydroxyacid dehydrogenase